MRPPSPSPSPLLHYIRGAFHDQFPGFSGFGFCRKLARTKTQQGTHKASEHNGRTVFSRDLVLLMHASTGVISTLSYHLSSIHYTSSQFSPTSLFASSSATDRLRHHLQINSPPTTKYSVPLVWAGMQKHTTASPPDLRPGPI